MVNGITGNGTVPNGRTTRAKRNGAIDGKLTNAADRTTDMGHEIDQRSPHHQLTYFRVRV